ncbi:MAG TPA: LysM peptidoglycan-binding domain-containing protein [Prosthecobacter sp.]|nr:LysM peptidoglycan-binding domain-containing protein [Prosthecobacter sp.]
MISAWCRPLLYLLCAALLPCVLDSCTSSSSVRGVPRNLPKIELYGSAATPPHAMEKKDYPFDSNGDYVTSWAALSGAPASGADIDRWKSSHGGSVSRKQPSPVKKVKSSSSSKGKGGSYTIKSGDTLSAIARKNNTTVAKLKAANGLSSDMIRAGKTLKIPR